MELEYPEAEFNSGLALIFQLDALEKGLIHATINSDYRLHYRMLVAYFKTLCNQSSDSQEKEQIEICHREAREDIDKICFSKEYKKFIKGEDL